MSEKKDEKRPELPTRSWLVPTVAAVTVVGALGYTYYVIQERRRKELQLMRYGSDLNSPYAHGSQSWLSSTFSSLSSKVSGLWQYLSGNTSEELLTPFVTEFEMKTRDEEF